MDADDDTGASPGARRDDRTVVVGMLGLGTVGSGVATLLTEHADELAARTGVPLRLGPVAVRDASRPRGVEGVALTTDPDEVVANPDVEVVVEVMGGVEPAYRLLTRALESGKSVVTANKELLARHGSVLMELASRHGVRLEFEAAVAGGVPIVKPLRESLAGDRVRRVLGILNGTTNYILTRMAEDGLPFADALAEAQRLGYAEADPSADVDGDDAASKAAILASLAFDTTVRGEDVHREGIRTVTQQDIALAARLGYAVKLLGIAERVHDRIGVRVHPALVPLAHPLASVRDAYNAIFIEADAVGQLMFYGPGAGSRPTASAVVGDLVTAVRARLAGERPIPSLGSGPPALASFDDVRVQYCVVLDVADAPGVLAAVASTFGEHDVSIETVLQEGRGDVAQLVLVTHAAREGDLRATLGALRRIPTVRAVASVLRVQGEET